MSTANIARSAFFLGRTRRGDPTYPSGVHEEEIPGLRDVEARAREVSLRYSHLPDGAKIEHKTGDPTLVGAPHYWLDARISDEGDHAEANGLRANLSLHPTLKTFRRRAPEVANLPPRRPYPPSG